MFTYGIIYDVTHSEMSVLTLSDGMTWHQV